MKTQIKLVGESIRPWTYFKSSDPGHCEGIYCDLIKYLSSSMNFTKKFIRESSGFKLKNGSWAGGIRKLLRGVFYFYLAFNLLNLNLGQIGGGYNCNSNRDDSRALQRENC